MGGIIHEIKKVRVLSARLAVLIGLSLSLCKKKELCETVATETLCEIQRVWQNSAPDKAAAKYLAEVENRLRDKAVYGNEALYRKSSPYIPDWKIGDTFSHTLTFPTADALGIKGWLILLYKVCEYVDEFGVHRQLMYASLCPPDKIPMCPKDLQELGFLPMMGFGDQYEYLIQMTIKSKKDEAAYELTRIGCFPNIPQPDNCCDENPLTAMPFFGRLRKTDQWPGYEDQICRLYREFIRYFQLLCWSVLC